VIDRTAWPVPPLFRWLQEQGNVADDEMLRVFNCGIGMALVVAEADAARALAALRKAGEAAWRIGRVEARARGEPPVTVHGGSA
jgi:phosphoribosylformylglycinamidine cyclo-ligase